MHTASAETPRCGASPTAAWASDPRRCPSTEPGPPAAGAGTRAPRPAATGHRSASGRAADASQRASASTTSNSVSHVGTHRRAPRHHASTLRSQASRTIPASGPPSRASSHPPTASGIPTTPASAIRRSAPPAPAFRAARSDANRATRLTATLSASVGGRSPASVPQPRLSRHAGSRSWPCRMETRPSSQRRPTVKRERPPSIRSAAASRSPLSSVTRTGTRTVRPRPPAAMPLGSGRPRRTQPSSGPRIARPSRIDRRATVASRSRDRAEACQGFASPSHSADTSQSNVSPASTMSRRSIGRWRPSVPTPARIASRCIVAAREPNEAAAVGTSVPSPMAQFDATTIIVASRHVIVPRPAAGSREPAGSAQPGEPEQPVRLHYGSRKLVWQVRSTEPSRSGLESTAAALPVPPVGRR